MDIVDAQLHLARGTIEETLQSMDAIGIASVLIDEFWGSFPKTHPTHIQPGFLLPNGAWRALWPSADEASLRYPERFSYLVRIDHRDPELEVVMRYVAANPSARAFRLQPVWTAEEAAAFARGEYDALLELAQELDLPVCLFVPGLVGLLEPYLRRFPKLMFVIDHCGMGFRGIPRDRAPAEEARARSPVYFDEVLKLARYPNLALKWSHAPNLFDGGAFPYEPTRPFLRRAITAFGADRLIWASDATVMIGHSWSDLVHAVLDDSELDDNERAGILGGAARAIFRWPADAG